MTVQRTGYRWEAFQPDGSVLHFEFAYDLRFRCAKDGRHCPQVERITLIGEGPRVLVRCAHGFDRGVSGDNCDEDECYDEAVRVWL